MLLNKYQQTQMTQHYTITYMHNRYIIPIHMANYPVNSFDHF